MIRVGVVGGAWQDSFASNVVAGLSELGVNVVRLGALRNASSRLRREIERLPGVAARRQRGVVDEARRHDLDLILSTNGQASPETVAALRDVAPVALWFPDAVTNLGQHVMLAGDYSMIYLKDPLAVDRIRSMIETPAVRYLAEGCNPALHRPIGDYGSHAGVVLPGNMYPVRVRLIERLAADGVAVRTYGNGVPAWNQSVAARRAYQGHAVWGEEKSRVMRTATAVLNNLHFGEMMSLNCRLFDATGAGAAVLCEDRPTLRTLFEPGVEVLPFRSYDELITSYRWVAAHPDEAKKIGDAASRRAHAEHTHAHRLRQVLTDLL